MRKYLFILVSGMVLMACGQKGPLVLPPKDVPPAAKPAPAAPPSDAPEKK